MLQTQETTSHLENKIIAREAVLHTLREATKTRGT